MDYFAEIMAFLYSYYHGIDIHMNLNRFRYSNNTFGT
jgi:hypothetical protein